MAFHGFFTAFSRVFHGRFTDFSRSRFFVQTIGPCPNSGEIGVHHYTTSRRIWCFYVDLWLLLNVLVGNFMKFQVGTFTRSYSVLYLVTSWSKMQTFVQSPCSQAHFTCIELNQIAFLSTSIDHDFPTWHVSFLDKVCIMVLNIAIKRSIFQEPG